MGSSRLFLHSLRCPGTVLPVQSLPTSQLGLRGRSVKGGLSTCDADPSCVVTAHLRPTFPRRMPPKSSLRHPIESSVRCRARLTGLSQTPHVLCAFLSYALRPGTESEVALLGIVTLQPSSGLSLNASCRLRLRRTRVGPISWDRLSVLDASGNSIAIYVRNVAFKLRLRPLDFLETLSEVGSNRALVLVYVMDVDRIHDALLPTLRRRL